MLRTLGMSVPSPEQAAQQAVERQREERITSVPWFAGRIAAGGRFGVRAGGPRQQPAEPAEQVTEAEGIEDVAERRGDAEQVEQPLERAQVAGLDLVQVQVEGDRS